VSSAPGHNAVSAPERKCGSSIVFVVDAPSGGYVDTPDVEGNVLGGDTPVGLLLVPPDRKDELYSLPASHIILWHRVTLDAEFFERNEACRGVICASVGYDHVDIEAARRHGVAIYHVPDYGTEEVADHTIALGLAARRKLAELGLQLREGGWDWQNARGTRRLRGQTWGIIGLGRIGTAVALRAKAFGMNVAFYDPWAHPGIGKSLAVQHRNSVEELLDGSDIVSLHTPLTEQTLHLIDAVRLRLMRTGSCLINTARGALVDISALREALDQERPAVAALDVVEGEPDVPGWLRADSRVILTPHSAFYSVESLIELRTRAAEAVHELITGREVTSAVPVT
jgi:lactate dehydrogenase-like 2-hydroxyacid dehydrogenase